MTSDPHELKTLARGFSRDMTPDAISRRLEIVGELNKLCHYLGTATPAPPEKKPSTKSSQNTQSQS